MPADSLKNMSLRACSKTTKRITDIGGMPYRIARPFLLKIDPTLWKQWKRATSKPRTLWATKALTLKSGSRQ